MTRRFLSSSVPGECSTFEAVGIASLESAVRRCGMKGGRMPIAHRIVLVLVIGLGVLAAGCGGPLEMTVAGTPDLNSGGNAAVVRVYELSGDSNFRTTSIGSFWRDDQAALGSEYIDHRQLLLYPDQVETVSIDVSDETEFIGIAADLRQPDEDAWRAIYPVDELKGSEVAISVGASRLAVNVQ